MDAAPERDGDREEKVDRLGIDPTSKCAVTEQRGGYTRAQTTAVIAST